MIFKNIDDDLQTLEYRENTLIQKNMNNMIRINKLYRKNVNIDSKINNLNLNKITMDININIII